MATGTQWATSLLDEAAAIVEAEWLRLQQDEALWERELAETPAPRPGPSRVGITTACRRWPGQPRPDDRRRCPPERWLPVPVRATQRSPPSPRACSNALSNKGDDA